MATSYNGWPASPTPSAIGIDSGFSAAGATFPGGVKRGDVSTIFRALVEFLDKHVEPVHAGWCWGYYYRQTTGGTSLSCHASGTAIDYNAPEHGYGSHGTWSGDQVRKVDAYLKDVLLGVVRWGEHYSGTVDGMHFEINASADAVARVAATLGDDMFEKDDSDRLERLEKKVDKLIENEQKHATGDKGRDQRIAERLAKKYKAGKEEILAVFKEEN